MNDKEEADRSVYAGRWIATIRGQIIGHGGTPQQAYRAAQFSRYKEIPKVTYVPTKPFQFSNIVHRVREILPDSVQAYLVGGAIRDAMLSKQIQDYDFLLDGDVFHLARIIANQISGAYYPLDENQGAARVIYTSSEGVRKILDFVVLKDSNLENDLRSRDFTINAMAVDLFSPQQLLDPLSGAADLWSKSLRTCSTSAFKDDPIRVIRAVRLAAAFDLKIIPDTRRLMVNSVSQLTTVSIERIRDEIFRILGGPRAHTSIRALDMIGALDYVLPELQALKGVKQSAPHIKDVWEHTLDTLKYLDTLIAFLSPETKPNQADNLVFGLCQLHIGMFRSSIEKHLAIELIPDRSLRSIIFFAALYHDIAKPLTISVEDDQRIRFLKHEKAGADIGTKRGIHLRLSNKEIDRLRIIIKNHMRPTLLARGRNGPSARAIYRFFRSTGIAGIDICLLSLADLLATYGMSIPQGRWVRQLKVVRNLMEAWWQYPEEKIDPPTILNGHDIIEKFGLSPGPELGILLESLREAQVSGEINSKKEAIRYVGELLKQKDEIN
jgi:tRNA nucleotidyltransferase/poly(A) polymerase